MLWLYRLLFLPALLVLAPGYLLRMRRRGGYRANFAHRFGGHATLPLKTPARPRVWLQAVSVGEMLAIAPILVALQREGAEVYLTTTTSTGYQLAQDRYRELTVGVGYFPIDWWPFVSRAWRRIAPDFVILIEGERWPEHLQQARQRGVRVLNINARLSDCSFARLSRFPAAARLMLRGVTRLLACSAQDEARFVHLGLDPARVSTTGNIKLDVQIAPLAEAERAQLRRELGLPAGLVLLGSSTWPGEEDALLRALHSARENGIRCSLLLVPRHAERRGEIEQVLRASRLRYHLRSRGAAKGEVDVALGDTTGELRNLTQLADVVFIGKSLPPHGQGQTPVEAAVLRKPMMFGPGMSNFRLLAADLVSRGAALIVQDATGLAKTATELLREEGKRARLSTAASEWQRENTGAVERTLAAMRTELTQIRPAATAAAGDRQPSG